MKKPLRTLGYAAGALAIAALVAWALRPEPLDVEVARVSRGPMEVTVEDRGEMRSHDRFTIVAPVAGRLMRIAIRDGDRVEEDQIVANIAPAPLGARERSEWSARVAAAQALQREAEERADRAQTDLAQARRERQRVERLVAEGFVSAQAADKARSDEAAAADEADAARFRARSAAADVRVARSALIAQAPSGGDAAALVAVRAPVAGRVLRVPDQSERVVEAGAPLMTIGDQSRLEAVIELLSSEAVKVAPGMPVRIEGWGGPEPLRAKVRLVEPFAFTKISALGVEEKRTNVIADLADPPGPLGDGYRIEARIVVWSEPDVLRAPASAVYRCAEGWCAFVVDDGRAKRRVVKIGQRNSLEVQLLEGVAEGDTLVRHPGNDLEDGARVAAR
ncbi:MAG: efflux RND transporter periplasmic adaptor subunit [Burkholderiaceae bacterium]|nr:efflux RND transporter periplasmic adaptor subunit [Burkholderiaceae bacterium]